MNNYLNKILLTLLITTSLFACSDDDKDVDIPLSEVPTSIVNTVQDTLPGISLTSAEKEIKENVVIYELEGKLLNNKEYEIKITEAGTIIKIELED